MNDKQEGCENYHDFHTQVTIIIYLSVVGALLLYMLFLLLVDPLIRKHDPYIQPLHNEEDAEVCISL